MFQYRSQFGADMRQTWGKQRIGARTRRIFVWRVQSVPESRLAWRRGWRCGYGTRSVPATIGKESDEAIARA